MKKITFIVLLNVIVVYGQGNCDSLLQQSNDLIHSNTNTEAQKDSLHIIQDIRYKKIDKLLSRSSGAFLAISGVIGVIFTIADVEANRDFYCFGQKAGNWSKLHTCTITISSGLILSGLLRLAH